MTLVEASPVVRPRELVALAVDALPRMQLPDGTFCFERAAGDPEPRGRSLRYTLIVLLGVQQAARSGVDAGLDAEELHAALWREIDGPELTAGDLGLLLLADARAGTGRGPELVVRLSRRLAAERGHAGLLGMELAWIVAGLAEQVALGVLEASGALMAALDQLLGANRARSGLFRHAGGGRRARFPNFAAQIYAVWALARVGRLRLDDRALHAARLAADRLIGLQLPDGGWPWLYDVERGTVADRYELYAVHQDAMAPMALLELAEAESDRRYVDAAARGLPWVAGANELGLDLVDRDDGLVHRSIRRRRVWTRASQAAGVASTVLARRAHAGAGWAVEVNRTDRPYHFGWILEAWSGREDALCG